MDFFLSIINSIKVGEEMPQNGIFKEYDKNSNSIWDEAEIKDLQTCVQKFASKDGDIASLSRKEMKSFVGYLLSKSNNTNQSRW